MHPLRRPLQVIDLGETHIPRELFDEFLVDVAPRFTMHTYNLLRHNCNNFSDEVANFSSARASQAIS